MTQIKPSHVAILVPSARKAANFLRKFDFQIGEEEKWDGEGTLEIYIERDKANSLLLMEPTKPGAYQRALDKRGPGLHHLAIDVLNLEAYIESLGGSGWLLHPKSLKTIKQVQTAYLARPGFPGLIEVQERKELQDLKLFVDHIDLKMESNLAGLVNPIGLNSIIRQVSHETILSLDGNPIKLAELF